MSETTDFKSLLALVKTSYDLADYMRSSGLTLKQNGVGKWKTNCPLHQEKTPSFVINDAFQNYRCFGCGKHGDILSFVMEYENLTFSDALRKLAEEKNITLTFGDFEAQVDIKSLQLILKHAANFYCKQFDALPEDHAAKKEILDRGLTFDNKKADWLRYGYSPSGNALYKHLSALGFTDDLLLESGLVRKSEKGSIYDFFRSRLMFVITDRYGKPVGFSSRKLFDDDTRGKYVNSSESPLFKKNLVLYNHSLARKDAGEKKELYICEGQFDVAAFVEAGMKNVVASSGTAFTKGHVTEIKKMVGPTGKLVFCFDGDSAGLKAAANVFLSFPEVHEDAYVVVFPDATDPCDFRQKEGNEALQELVEKPQPIVEFMILRAKQNHDLDSAVGRAKYVDEAANIIKTITNMTLRESCSRLLSLEAFTPLTAVKEAIEKASPLTFEQWEKPSVDNEEPVLERPVFEASSLDLEKIKLLAASDPFYKLSVQFVNLGFQRQAWRTSVARSAHILPPVFGPFLEELEKYSDKNVLIPELFSDSAVAEFFMEDAYSSFYKFMSLEELKDHFIFLHSKLEKVKAEKQKQKIQRRVQELLASEHEGDFDFFKELLAKEEEALRDLTEASENVRFSATK